MIQKRIANIKRYTIDFRFINNSECDKTFDDKLNALIKKSDTVTMKKTMCDVSDEYEDEIIEEVCENCGKRVQVYLLKPSFCMNCGKIVLPCSMCKTCTGCKEGLQEKFDEIY